MSVPFAIHIGAYFELPNGELLNGELFVGLVGVVVLLPEFDFPLAASEPTLDAGCDVTLPPPVMFDCA